MRTVLVVDDKELMRDSVGATLQRAGFSIATADGAQAALDQIAQRRPDCVVTDMKMPGMTGCELLEKIRQIDDDLPVVMMTAFGTIETAVKAMKLGAFDYLTKPFEGDELIISVKRAIEHARILRENALLRAGSDGAPHAGQPRTAPRHRPPHRQLARDARPARTGGRDRQEPGHRPGPRRIGGRQGGRRARSTSPGHAARGHSSPSTARRSPSRCSRANSSVTSGAPSPGPTSSARAASSWPTTARSCSTR
jgi:CheY-like chemotaxis protein